MGAHLLRGCVRERMLASYRYSDVKQKRRWALLHGKVLSTLNDMKNQRLRVVYKGSTHPVGGAAGTKTDVGGRDMPAKPKLKGRVPARSG